MSRKVDVRTLVENLQDRDSYRELHWEGNFQEYVDLVSSDPRLARSAFQRVYDMVMSYGTEEYVDSKKRITHYRFFDDPMDGGADAIYGMDISLMRLVNVFKSAAHRYGTERRVILLHGPVGSAKSTIARLLKKGLETYSRTPEGALYTFEWTDHHPETGDIHVEPCPMHEEPLRLIPAGARSAFLEGINADLPPERQVVVSGELDPFCRRKFEELEQRYSGDWTKVLEHVRVRRLVLSEKDRVGIGTFQPKDEKNQDSTELTGDINYRKIAEYGSESDPRAFNFDGEFNIANRGLIEFVEVLKLDVAFLYDLLGASQEHRIKPKKFAQTDIDEVILGHTNEPEYRKLEKNEYMEALRDRTVKIDVPYITKLSEEIKIYLKDYNPDRIRGRHIAPHTIEMAAMWAVLTRLEEPKKADLTLLQKLKLYDGKSLPGYTDDNVRELRKETSREGMDGISPRYIQDKISNALVSETGRNSINPFMVLSELESGLKHHTLVDNEEKREHYRQLLGVVREEYENIVKNEVQRAIAADEEAISKLCANYIDNVKAYTQKEKVRNPYTGQDEEPDERLMRSIEEKIDIPDTRKDDFRREIMNYIGALAIEGKTFNYRMNSRLQRALELKLFEDQKDTIKLTTLVSNVVDKDTQEKIDIVKSRLIKNYGYDEESATDVLNFVSSIFARGDASSEDPVVIARIEQDHARFRDIVRGRIRRSLRRYIQQGELVGRQGRKLVSIPVPSIELPRFVFGDNSGGVGQGEGEPGTPLEEGGEEGAGKAGDQPGKHMLEVEVSLEELAEMLGEELELPNIQPRGDREVASDKAAYRSIRRTGPESLRHFRRTYKKALRRQIASGTYDRRRPVIIPIRDDVVYRSWNESEEPTSNAVILYMMDVSGSMGDEQKEVVRIESFWIDTWLRSQYRNVERRFLVHDAAAREVDEDTFYRLRESGGTKISSAYELGKRILDEEYPATDWNIYPFHFSDGDNWGGGDTEHCLKLLEESFLPRVNQFSYGQVESPYGSGQFIKDLEESFGEEETLVVSRIDGKEGIPESIRDFLGKGH